MNNPQSESQAIGSGIAKAHPTMRAFKASSIDKEPSCDEPTPQMSAIQMAETITGMIHTLNGSLQNLQTILEPVLVPLEEKTVSAPENQDTKPNIAPMVQWQLNIDAQLFMLNKRLNSLIERCQL